MGIALALASLAFMYKSTDGLSIGWVAGSGPGAGAWPFWLSAVMFLSCVAIVIRTVMRITVQSRSDEIFMDREAVYLIGVTTVALAALLLGTYYIGIYISLMVFLMFFLRVLGGHTWTLSIVLTIAIPIVVFVFFEYLLVIPLPKGMSEPLFYPIYDLMY